MAPTRRAVTRWILWFVLAVMAVALLVHTVRAEEKAVADAQDSTTQELQTATMPEFIPTGEWQDILPGQSVPPGLHVRMNLATGKKEAKLLSEDDEESVEALPESAESDSVTVATDVTGEIKGATVQTPRHSSEAQSQALAVVEEEDAAGTDEVSPVEKPSESEASDVSESIEDLDEAPPAKEPNWNHEKIYEVLEALPEPPSVDGMDIHEARAKLSEPEFRRQMIKLWKKRQEELKEALNSLQDDAKYLGNLLEQFSEAEKNGDVDGQLRVLEVLEWEVQDLDKTQVFNFIGGFGIMTEYLNSTNLAVRASASWLIGTAVKNYKDGQDWAINAGAVPRLVASLELPIPTDDAEQATAVFEVKKKATYALSSLVRFNPRAQRLFLSLDGTTKLAKLMEAPHPLGVQLKAVLFVHDLLHEDSVQPATEGDEAALEKLHEAFRLPVWCSHTATFLKDFAAKLQRTQQTETILAMYAQLPSCKTEFLSANVKPVIEAVVSAWRADDSLDADERQDLLDFGDAILSEL